MISSLEKFQKVEDSPPKVGVYFPFFQPYNDLDNLEEEEKSPWIIIPLEFRKEAAKTPEGTKKLFIKSQNDKLLCIDVNLTDKIEQLKAQIQKDKLIPSSSQKLFFNNIPLEDSRCLSDYNIIEYASLRLIKSSRGGPIADWLKLHLIYDKMKYITLNISYRGKTDRLYCLWSITIGDLKLILAVKTAIPTEEVELFFQGRMLVNDEKKLEEYGIKDGSKIFLVISSWGGDCFKLMQDIYEQKEKSLENIKIAFRFLQNPQDINLFYSDIKEPIQRIRLSNKFQDFSKDKLLAILLWTGNLIYKQVNSALSTNQGLSIWKFYLKHFFEALKFVPYYKGTVYRGIRNEQNKEDYVKGAKIVWKTISGLSKNSERAKQVFSDKNGTLFEVDVISARDISELSLYPQEEEVILPPYSCLEVIEAKHEPNQPFYVKLREIPMPKGPKVVFWVDDNPEHNFKYAYTLEQKNISCVFCTSTKEAIDLIDKFKWILDYNMANFRIVTDMTRVEDGRVNFCAGIDLLKALSQDYKYNFKALIYCTRVDEAEMKCKKAGLEGRYIITHREDKLMEFLDFTKEEKIEQRQLQTNNFENAISQEKSQEESCI